jgi:hypothetical protein
MLEKLWEGFPFLWGTALVIVAAILELFGVKNERIMRALLFAVAFFLINIAGQLQDIIKVIAKGVK